MVFPLSGFTAFPNPYMIPFMGMQSWVIGIMFGMAYQGGKRMISKMTNEEFNVLDLNKFGFDQMHDILSKVPQMQEMFAEMRPMVEIMMEELTPLLKTMAESVPEVVSSMFKDETPGEGYSFTDILHKIAKGVDINTYIPEAEGRRPGTRQVTASAIIPKVSPKGSQYRNQKTTPAVPKLSVNEFNNLRQIIERMKDKLKRLTLTYKKAKEQDRSYTSLMRTARNITFRQRYDRNKQINLKNIKLYETQMAGMKKTIDNYTIVINKQKRLFGLK